MPKYIFIPIPMWVLIIGMVLFVSRPISIAVGYEKTNDNTIKNTLFVLSTLWTASVLFILPNML